MISMTLWKRELKANSKVLLIFLAVISLYGTLIVAMFDPTLGESLSMMANSMPEIFEAFGMSNPGATLLEFVGNYLYGFILVVIPLICIILLCNRLIVRYVDHGSMAYLLATPNKRVKIITTQAGVLCLSIFLLVAYAFLLIIVCGKIFFQESIDLSSFFLLNAGLLGLLLFYGGMAFLSACIFQETKLATGVGAGIAVFCVLVQMLSQVSDKLDFLRYLTPMTLFQVKELIAQDGTACLSFFVLYVLAAIMFIIGINVFQRKDLSL